MPPNIVISSDLVSFVQPDAILTTLISYAPLIAVVIAILIIIPILLRVMARRYQTSQSFKNAVLMVTVPKESSEKGEGANRDKTLQEIQEDIAVAVGVFKSIGGLTAQRGLKAALVGRDDAFSFEIVAQGGMVTFYIVVPKDKRAFIEQQVHAQYPLAQIEESPDYNIFPASCTIKSTRLVLRREAFFPILGFKKLETDPLNALTNALAKVEKDEGAAIQLIVRSAKREWRGRGVRIASVMQQGLSFHQAKKKISVWGSVFGSNENKNEKSGDAPKVYKLSPLEEEMVKSIEEKVASVGLDVNINVVSAAPDPEHAKMHLENIVGAFSQFNSPQYGNSFTRNTAKPKRILEDFVFRIFSDKLRVVLTGEELAGIWHLPLSSTETPNIRWLAARKAPPPSNLPKEGTILGYVKYRGQDVQVRIKPADRRRHMYIIGKSGSGKSVLLKNLMKQDIEAGAGMCVMDPHGELAQDVVKLVPKSRVDDVIYFNPADVERPMGLNMIEYDERFPEQKTFAVNELLKIFDKLYDLKSTGGPMFEQYMRNALILIMDHPESGSTLMEIPRVLADEKFRAFKLSKCKTQSVKDFWQKEAQKAGGEASLANMVPYITSKLTPFITNDIMRPIIGQQKSAFNFRQVMDEGKILLLDLSKGKLGDLNAYLIGMVVVGKILAAALSRADMDTKARKDFFLYIDEFQNFLTDSIATILSEARKYGLDLVIAHQFISQLTGKGGDNTIRDAVFGNVGSMIAFRIGAEDADFLEKEFQPVFSAADLVNVEAYTANAKILIDGTGSRAFNMATYPEVAGDAKFVEAMKQLSRLKYGRDRDIVEAEIVERTRLVI